MAKFDFNPKIAGFDFNNALRMAEMAYLAYKPQIHIKKFMRGKWRFNKFKFLSGKETQAFMVANDEIIILTFRGTDSIEDWITDADARLVKGPWGRVHRGFREALNCIWHDIKRTLTEFQYKSQPFWIAGHSLGGALATLAAAKFIKEEYKRPKGIYTFGQPRVGNKIFVRDFNALLKRRTFRFVNNEDIVTRVPPRTLKYEHIGNACYLDNSGKLHRDEKWWRQFLDSSVSTAVRSVDRFRILREEYPNGIDDHSMHRYIKRIKANFT
ncbi:MAG: lipase family protein [Candidatus Omnitrophica bacterium]|nr:lipase family protein [Candidatus Omnitrophota bacterium]